MEEEEFNIAIFFSSVFKLSCDLIKLTKISISEAINLWKIIHGHEEDKKTVWIDEKGIRTPD